MQSLLSINFECDNMHDSVKLFIFYNAQGQVILHVQLQKKHNTLIYAKKKKINSSI